MQKSITEISELLGRLDVGGAPADGEDILITDVTELLAADDEVQTEGDFDTCAEWEAMCGSSATQEEAEVEEEEEVEEPPPPPPITLAQARAAAMTLHNFTMENPEVEDHEKAVCKLSRALTVMHNTGHRRTQTTLHGYFTQTATTGTSTS